MPAACNSVDCECVSQTYDQMVSAFLKLVSEAEEDYDEAIQKSIKDAEAVIRSYKKSVYDLYKKNK